MTEWEKATRDAPLVAPQVSLDDLADTAEVEVQRRYFVQSMLGAGGMGEVRLVRDARIGRDVAMKVMRAHAVEPERFLREARVQGQLEHPSIVPVYDLAEGDEGELYFTMKRVKGVTLEHVALQLAAGDPQARATYTRRKLMSSFVSVCLAVDFAHSRGVVHRDLKPSNVMLGDFGEVYVLDWGIAKLVHDREPEARKGEHGEHRVQRYATEGGMVLGTAGYMAPEQVLGEPLDARTDVYALGAILFELLTGTPLNVGDSSVELTSCTLADSTARVREHCLAHELPPELEAICLRATALSPLARYANARALSNAIERFLDGDRDVERRRELAIGHATAARIELTAALHDRGDEAARRRAMLEAGRALGLDPECTDAARTMMALMTAPPTHAPAEVLRELAESRARAARVAGPAGALGFAAIFVMVPFILWMGVRDWSLLFVGMLCIVTGAAASLATGRWPQHGQKLMLVLMVVTSVLLAILTRLFGPFLAAPAIAIGVAVAGGFHPLAGKFTPTIFACVGLLAPFGLELAGVISPSYVFAGDRLVIHAMLASFPLAPTVAYLVLSSTLLVIVVSAYVIVVRRALEKAQTAVLVQSWQLRQLMPEVARDNLATTSPRQRDNRQRQSERPSVRRG